MASVHFLFLDVSNGVAVVASEEHLLHVMFSKRFLCGELLLLYKITLFMQLQGYTFD
jgi:hypothetical protein